MTVDTAADAFRAVRLGRDEGRAADEWAAATGKRHGVPLVRLFGRHVVDMGTGRRPLGGDLAVEALAEALTPATAAALVRECRTTARRLGRGREAAVASKLTALADLVDALSSEQ